MPTSIGQFTQLAYILETAFGTTPSTPTGQRLPIISGVSFAPEADYIDSREFRQDGLAAAGRRGALKGKATIPGELRYGAWDDFMAAVCGLFEWSTNVAKIKAISVMGAATVTVAATGKTFTRAAGSFLTDGFAVGDYVVWSGFTNSGNNITVKITTLTATVMTCSGATGLVDEASVTTAKCCTNIRPSFTTEMGRLLVPAYFADLGLVINTMKLSGKSGSTNGIDISFEALSKSVSNEAGGTLFSAVNAVTTNPIITGWEGSIKRAGTAMANVVGWDLEVSRNCDTAEVCGSSSLYDIQPTKHTVKGSLELYFGDNQPYTDYRAETDLALQIILGSGSAKSYQIDLTKCRYKNWKGDPADKFDTVTVDFESYAPDSGTNTSFMLTRIP